MLNREQRRNRAKKTKSAKKLYSLEDVQEAITIALGMKKLSKGHLFNKKMKDRCTFCGLTPKTKKECPYWVLTFLDRIQTILINPTFFMDDNIQALWLQHDFEYQDIKLPMVVDVTDEKT